MAFLFATDRNQIIYFLSVMSLAVFTKFLNVSYFEQFIRIKNARNMIRINKISSKLKSK